MAYTLWIIKTKKNSKLWRERCLLNMHLDFRKMTQDEYYYKDISQLTEGYSGKEKK